jgi:hypothetical protein
MRGMKNRFKQMKVFTYAPNVNDCAGLKRRLAGVVFEEFFDAFNFYYVRIAHRSQSSKTQCGLPQAEIILVFRTDPSVSWLWKEHQ